MNEIFSSDTTLDTTGPVEPPVKLESAVDTLMLHASPTYKTTAEVFNQTELDVEVHSCEDETQAKPHGRQVRFSETVKEYSPKDWVKRQKAMGFCPCFWHRMLRKLKSYM